MLCLGLLLHYWAQLRGAQSTMPTILTFWLSAERTGQVFSTTASISNVLQHCSPESSEASRIFTLQPPSLNKYLLSTGPRPDIRRCQGHKHRLGRYHSRPRGVSRLVAGRQCSQRHGMTQGHLSRPKVSQGQGEVRSRREKKEWEEKREEGRKVCAGLRALDTSGDSSGLGPAHRPQRAL
jgi:hypothetical protein